MIFTATFQVGDNGIISLNNSFNFWTPILLPLNGNRFIAPYWADVDLTGTGEVYYRQTTNPTLLARATKHIQAAFPFSQNVIITNLFIVTWDAVGYYLSGTNKVKLHNFLHTYTIIVMTTNIV